MSAPCPLLAAPSRPFPTARAAGFATKHISLIRVAAGRELYAPSAVDWLSSHSYPYSGEPFGTDRATRGLTYYRNESHAVGRGSTFPVILTETGWRQTTGPMDAAADGAGATPPLPAPTDGAQQADWTVLAYQKIWLRDPQIRAVCPFLLEGKFWEASGWPWVVGGKEQPVFEATRALRTNASLSIAAGGGTKISLKSDDVGCPSGLSIVPKKGYRPQANGCGPAGMRQTTGDQYGLHECCNGHDTCYSACGASYEFCEASFKECMIMQCQQWADSVQATSQNYASLAQHEDRCRETALSFSGMTKMMGRGIYAQSVGEACQCVPDAQLERTQVEYLAWFLRTYSASSLAVQRPDDGWELYAVAERDGMQVRSPIQYGVVNEDNQVIPAADWLYQQSRETSDAAHRRRQLHNEAWRRYGMRDEQPGPHGGMGGVWWRLAKWYPQHVEWHGLAAEQCVAKTDDGDNPAPRTGTPHLLVRATGRVAPS
eukprot:COSAG04_NODE_57_length_30587_cov_86.784632_31_plen_486_part_00